MDENINEFVTIVKQKNGKSRITFNASNESRIYKLLRELGYRQFKLNNKHVYFKRENQNLIPVSFIDIDRAFIDFLESLNFDNLSEDISRVNILNEYYKKRPLKRNETFNHHLQESLNSDDQHQLKRKTDAEYNRKFEIEQMLLKFNEWSFKTTVDKVGNFGTNDNVYYKSIGQNKFLIFNHYNSKKWFIAGFDCWIATFKNENDISTKMCLTNQDLKLGFRLERDFGLIKQYLN